jgi:DNA-binding transcriptional LysR family regulator
VAAGWQVRELAPERVGVVVAPASGRAAPAACTASALLQETLLHTSSRPQAWPAWAQAHALDTAKLQLGTGEHLYYLLEAAVAGLGPAIAPEPLVAEDWPPGDWSRRGGLPPPVVSGCWRDRTTT